MTSLNQLCPKKEVCGSCSWSDIPYPEQLRQKLEGINLSLDKAKQTFRCEDIFPSPMTSHYRNRMDFVVNYHGDFGLREKGKWWKVIDNHTCFLPDRKIISLFNSIYPWVKSAGIPYYDRKSGEGYLRYVVIRTATTGDSLVTVLTSQPRNPEDKLKISQALKPLAANPDLASLVWAGTASASDVSVGETATVIKGHGYIQEKIGNTSYIIRPSSFFQTNPYAAEILQQKVVELVTSTNLTPNASVLDLYCGSGFFTLPLSRLFKNVTGVESVPDAIEDAIYNNKTNGLSAHFVLAKTETIGIGTYNPALVILDPPRAGLHPKVLKEIMTAKPDYLLYVSCKYEKFIEELKEFTEAYKPVNCLAVDMFPHTPHVELVTLFKKV